MRIRPIILAGLIASLIAADVTVVATRRGPAPDVSGESLAAHGTEGSREKKGARAERSDARDGGAAEAGDDRAVAAEEPGLHLPYMPPEPGRYRFRFSSETTTDDGLGERRDESTRIDVYRYRAATRAGRTMRQAVTVRQGDDGGTSIRTHRWSARGLHRIKTVTDRSDGRTHTCTHDPPDLLVPLPLRVGTTWEPEISGCEEEPSRESSGSGEVTQTGEILREETITVAGTSVRCFVIRTTLDASGAHEHGSASSSIESLTWFSPEHRLIVRTYVEMHGEFDFGMTGSRTMDGVFSSEILSLTPA